MTSMVPVLWHGDYNNRGILTVSKIKYLKDIKLVEQHYLLCYFITPLISNRSAGPIYLIKLVCVSSGRLLLPFLYLLSGATVTIPYMYPHILLLSIYGRYPFR